MLKHFIENTGEQLQKKAEIGENLTLERREFALGKIWILTVLC